MSVLWVIIEKVRNNNIVTRFRWVACGFEDDNKHFT